MDEVGEGPDHRDADEGDAEQDDVEKADAQQVGQPHAPAAHDPRVGVHLAVSGAHIHPGTEVGVDVRVFRRPAWFHSSDLQQQQRDV